MGFSEEAQIAMMLGSMQTQINTVIKDVSSKSDKQDLVNQSYSGRIRVLEDAKLSLESRSTLISTLVSAGVSIIAFLIGKFF